MALALSGRDIGIVAFLAVGYLIGLPVLAWMQRDLHAFRRMLWTGYGNRAKWLRWGTISYAAGGWPVLLVALAWRRSGLRAELYTERDDFRTEGDAHRYPSEGGTS
jgi:hypothetical protein